MWALHFWVGVDVRVLVGVEVGVRVLVDAAVGVHVLVFVGEGVALAVTVDVGVFVGVLVRVAVALAVAEAVGVERSRWSWRCWWAVVRGIVGVGSRSARRSASMSGADGPGDAVGLLVGAGAVPISWITP